jgi:hypothetical protein
MLKTYSQQTLNMLFHSQAVIGKDGRHVCPRCQIVCIERIFFRQIQEGGWDLVTQHFPKKKVVLCNKCSKEYVQNTLLKGSSGVMSNCENLYASKHPSIKDDPERQGAVEWLPDQKVKAPKKVVLADFKLTGSDRVRLKAKSILTQYQAKWSA